MTTAAPDLAAQIAARYGASVAPGVVVQRIPRGVSSRPLPVWDEKKRQLIVPDWKEEKERMHRASVRAGQKRRKAARVADEAKLQQLRDLHAAGARVPAMAAALGITEVYCRSMLKREGLSIERVNPGPSRDTLRRVAEIERLVGLGRSREAIAEALGFASVKLLGDFVRRSMPGFSLKAMPRERVQPVRLVDGKPVESWDERRALVHAKIRRLVAEGADEPRLAAELGISCRRYLRRVVRSAVPGHVFAAAPRVPGIGDRDAAIRSMLDRLPKGEVAKQLGLTINQVSASIRRSRKAGLLEPALDRRLRQRDRPAGVSRCQRAEVAARDSAVLKLVHDFAYVDIGQKLNLTLSQVKCAVARLRRSGALPPASEARMPHRPGSVNGAAPRMVARTGAILELHHSGALVGRIAAETGASRKAVISAIRRAGFEPRLDRSAPKADRLAELPQLVAQGLTGQQIADRWGKRLSYVYRLASTAGIGLGRNAAPHNLGEVSRAVAARRELVRHLYQKGHTHAQMRELLQVSPATLASDIKALGLSGTSAYARARAAAKAARMAGGAA